MSISRVKPSGRTTVRTAGQGFLEIYHSAVGDLPVLHVEGSPEEMGFQYGALVGDRVRQNMDLTVEMFAASGLPGTLVPVLLDKAWLRLAPHTPERYLREMAAIADGARAAGFDVTLDDVRRLTAVTNFDLYKREERVIEILGDDAAPLLEQMTKMNAMSCTMFAVWGARTVGGKMFASRNLDWVSQTGMHENRLLTVYRPDDRHGFVTMGYAGVIGALAGINEKGIAFSEIGAFSAREELDGTPWVLIARRVLEESDCLAQGVEIVQRAKHTIGYNYMIGDGDPDHFGGPEFQPRAVVFETNFVCCETFYEDDPQEHEARWGEAQYGLPLKEAVLRADMAFGRTSRALQAADNGPGDPANDGDPAKAPTYADCHKPMHDMIRAYADGTEYVYPLRGTKVIEAGAPRKIDINEALTIAATVAHNTEKLAQSDWNVMSVVYAPTDLEFWVAYESCDDARGWKNAPDSGYVEFSVVALLHTGP